MANNYRALTRTYRPQTFDDIVSQEHVTSTLKNAIKQNRISHAYMFCGPRGVGKTTMARVLARAVNEVDIDIDGEALNQTLNIVEMDAASNRKIEDVRQLKDVVRVPPQSGNYKIFIIDEVHMLTKEAFNALLKTLEEPPAHAIFIFATTEPHKVLPTILSRVQRFDFRRISVEEIVDRLKHICSNENITIDDESLHIIAKKADGALRDALGLMDQAIAFCGMSISHDELLKALNVIGNDLLFKFTDAVQNRDSSTGLNLIHRLMKEGADILEFLVSMTEHIRNLYIAKQDVNMYLVEATPETKERYKTASSHFSEEDLMRMLHLVSDAQIKIKDVQQPRVHFEILMLKLIHMSRSNELKKLIAGLEELKKNGSNQVAVAKPEKASSTVSRTETNGHTPSHQTDSSPKRDTQVTEPSSNGHDTIHHESFDETDQKSDPANYIPYSTPTPPISTSETYEDEDDDNDDLIVKPSLGFAKGISSSNSANTVEHPSTEVVEKREVKSITSLQDVEANWKDYINQLKDSAPQMLYFQMMRVQLKELKGKELLISTDSEFGTNMVEENQQLLSTYFKEVTGVFMRMKCIVERADTKEKESISPYERFKELQKKDPHLQTIVDLFGAELEY